MLLGGRLWYSVGSAGITVPWKCISNMVTRACWQSTMRRCAAMWIDVTKNINPETGILGTGRRSETGDWLDWRITRMTKH